MKSIHKKSLARLAAVQSIYQSSLVGGSVEELVATFREHFQAEMLEALNAKKYDASFFEELLHGVHENLEAIDILIGDNLPESWSISRLDGVLKAILRAGVFEIKYSGIDFPIVMNEYINITHMFHGGKEPGFVNALLHKISIG